MKKIYVAALLTLSMTAANAQEPNIPSRTRTASSSPSTSTRQPPRGSTKSVRELNMVQFNSLSTSQHQSEPPARHKSIFHQSMTRKRNTACFTCSTVSVATRMNG